MSRSCYALLGPVKARLAACPAIKLAAFGRSGGMLAISARSRGAAVAAGASRASVCDGSPAGRTLVEPGSSPDSAEGEVVARPAKTRLVRPEPPVWCESLESAQALPALGSARSVPEEAQPWAQAECRQRRRIERLAVDRHASRCLDTAGGPSHSALSRRNASSSSDRLPSGFSAERPQPYEA